MVRFRGMVQDMHNPEFYFEQFEVFNTKTNEIKSKTGKYTDTANIQVCKNTYQNLIINYEKLQSFERDSKMIV